MTDAISAALSHFIQTSDKRPIWNQAIPFEIYAKIDTLADFLVFMEFAHKHLGTQYVEYGCEDTDRYLSRILPMAGAQEDIDFARSKNVTSDLGILAYLMIMAAGNE